MELDTSLETKSLEIALKKYVRFIVLIPNKFFQISWADLTISEWLDFWESRSKGILDKYSHLKEFKQKIRSLPNIAKWIETRPHTEF